MATTQALLIENTIKDMKKAMTRVDDASDSDSSITRHTNRGNKLKRKAKYVREGHLAQADGPQVYKKRILYNDYPRYIISRNPPRVDQDGDVVDSENDNSDLDTTDAEDDPYRDVRVENILMPLTSAADLDKHPSLSVPYTNQILEQMVQNGQDMVQREQAALWRLKRIQTQFCGDEPYAAAGAYQGEEKMEDFQEQLETLSAAPSVMEETNAQTPANWDTMTNVRLMAGLENAADGAQAAKSTQGHEQNEIVDGDMNIQQGAHESGFPQEQQVNGDQANIETTSVGAKQGQDTHKIEEYGANVQADISNQDEATQIINSNGPASTDEEQHKRDNAQKTERDTTNGDLGSGIEVPNQEAPIANGNDHTREGDNISTQDYAMEDANAPDGTSTTSEPRRMATRAHTRAQAPDTNGQPTPAASPHLSSVATNTTGPQIHPFFIPPPQSIPTATGGLQQSGLADEARRYLSLYVQKQQEVTRQTNELLVGLRRALRLKNNVWDWCRAEGHVGEMSDGEDWIDAEKWEVAQEDLRKGEEVEDEDPAGMVVKKTRNRRGAQ